MFFPINKTEFRYGAINNNNYYTNNNQEFYKIALQVKVNIVVPKSNIGSYTGIIINIYNVVIYINNKC